MKINLQCSTKAAMTDQIGLKILYNKIEILSLQWNWTKKIKRKLWHEKLKKCIIQKYVKTKGIKNTKLFIQKQNYQKEEKN